MAGHFKYSELILRGAILVWWKSLGVDTVTLCLSATRALAQKRKALIARLHQHASRWFARIPPCSGSQRQCLELISTVRLGSMLKFTPRIELRRCVGLMCCSLMLQGISRERSYEWGLLLSTLTFVCQKLIVWLTRNFGLSTRHRIATYFVCSRPAQSRIS